MNHREDFGDDHYLITHEVDPRREGIRLDAFLKERYRSRSRQQLQKAIEDGAITVNRQAGGHLTLGRLKPSLQLWGGDEVLVLSERKPEPEVDFNYRILFEDENFFVIDKPANLPVHPAGRYFFNTLLVHLKTHGHKDPLSLEREYFLVHRIDKETSGVLLLTKNRGICADITRQFAERKTKKRYLAIVRGHPEREEFGVELAMKRSTVSEIKLKMMIAPESDGGQSASTQFRVLSRHSVGGQPYALVACMPRTGRQHQIRLHLEAAGYPIVGDKLYGRPEGEALPFYQSRFLSPEALARLVLPRHALHATQLELTHPLTRETLVFRAPLPEDLRAFLGLAPAPNSG